MDLSSLLGTDYLQHGTAVVSACLGSFTRPGHQLVLCNHSCFTVWSFQQVVLPWPVPEHTLSASDCPQTQACAQDDPQLLQTAPLLKPGYHVCSVSARPLDSLLVWHLDGTLSVWRSSQGQLEAVQRLEGGLTWEALDQVAFLPQSRPVQQPGRERHMGNPCWLQQAGGLASCAKVRSAAGGRK